MSPAAVRKMIGTVERGRFLAQPGADREAVASRAGRRRAARGRAATGRRVAQRGASVGRGRDLVAGGRQGFVDEPQHVGVVVDDENAFGAHQTGLRRRDEHGVL